jgi:hypothetical protein
MGCGVVFGLTCNPSNFWSLNIDCLCRIQLLFLVNVKKYVLRVTEKLNVIFVKVRILL